MKRAILILFLLLVSNGKPVYADTNAHGEELFNGNCAMCHPHGGNVLSPKKILKGEAFLKQFPKDAMIAAIVRKGIPNSVMSPFPKDRLSDAQVAQIVAYVRTLTPSPPAKKDAPKTDKSRTGSSGQSPYPTSK